MESPNMYSSNKNPLEYPLILEQIFKFSSVNDLKVIRQVCKFWRDGSLKKWKSSTVIRIGTNSSELIALSDARIEKFLIYVQKGNYQEFPTQFFANSFYFMFTRNEQFWNICGKFIKKLEIKTVLFTDSAFWEAIYNQCSNLMELTLKDFATSFSKTKDGLEDTEWEPNTSENWNLKFITVDSVWFWSNQRIWEEMFNHYPGIENLILRSVIGGCNELLRSITTIRKDFPEKLKLKQLETIDCCRDIRDIQYYSEILHETMTDSKLSFESLSFKVLGNDLDETKRIRSILTTHASSLKKLSIKKDHCSFLCHDPINSFPIKNQGRLDNLQVLELHNQVFTNWTFLKFTPNLTKMVICYHSCESIKDTKSFEIIGVKLEKLRELKLYNLSKDCDYENFEKINEWLPNVEILDITHLTNESFSSICKLWPNLISLNIVDGYVNEIGISGWDEEDVKHINTNGAESTWRPITVPRANLACLKDLRHLSLHAANGYSDFKRDLGYCGSLVFLEIPKLNSLTLQNYNSEPAIWRTIFEKHPLTAASNYFPVH